MRITFIAFLVVCISSGVVLRAGSTRMVTQNFDSDPKWTGVQNAAAGNSYGYQKSQIAGGSVGEVGGTFSRFENENYYADTALGGAFKLSDSFEASGKFAARAVDNMNNLVQIGHRSAATEDASFVGLAVIEGGVGKIRVAAEIVLSDGTSLLGPTTYIDIGEYSFKFVFDPHGGDKSEGRLTVTVMKGTTEVATSVVDLTLEEKTVGCTLDAFGIGSNRINPLDVSGEVFIDDVTYSAVAKT